MFACFYSAKAKALNFHSLDASDFDRARFGLCIGVAQPRNIRNLVE
jgi:hypothetical protein